VQTHTDPRGLIVTNTYDNLQRLTNITFPDGTATNYTYSKLDLVKVVDRLGFTNSFGYDSVRRLTSQTNALGRVTSYAYCTCGALSYITNALLQVTQFLYDNQGNRTTLLYPDSYVITNQYNLLRQLTNTTDSGGVSVTNWFNNQGLTVAVSNYFGQAQAMIYDVLDRATNSVDANNVTINSTYDNLNRLRTRSYPDSGVESFGYTVNTAGLTSYTNQLSQVTQYGYDAESRETFETNANLEVTQYSYAPANDLRTLTDGKSQVTTWNYDIFGMVSNKMDAASNVILIFHYDANERLTNRWSVAKGNTYYAYDAVGNLTNVSYPVSPTNSFTYDALNRLTNMVDAVGTSGYGYDAANELLNEDGPWASDTVSYTYNNRLRSSVSVLQPNADPWSQTYGYDPARRLTNTASPAGSFGYAYDATRQLQVSKLSLPNGAYITNDFDSVARLLDTWLKNNGNAVLNSHSYAYNQGNQRTSQTRTLGDYVNYGYDPIRQLTNGFGYESNGTARLNEKLSYAYDTAHNLNYRTNNALVQTFGVNNLNELSTLTRSGTLTVEGTTSSQATNVTVNSLTASLYNDATFAKDGFTVANGNNTFTAIASDSIGRSDTNAVTVNLPATNSYIYDLNGNLTSDGTRGFDYDDENQLIRVTVTNAWKSEFTYDGRLRRRIRKEFTWSSAWVQTNEVHYVYDGKVAIQERDANNLALTTYTRGNDLSGSLQWAGGIGGLLALSWPSVVNPQHYFYHADGNGNITALINSQQIVLAKYLYDPFGNILSTSGPLAQFNRYLFSSKECDQNSGLVYYLYRYYEPNLQRWLNRDPINEEGGINLYGYIGNNPVSGIDPDGRILVIDDVLEIGAADVAAATALGAYIGSGGPQKDAQAIADAYTAVANAVADAYRWCTKAHGQGERKFTGKPTGKADNPYKGWQVDPKDPTKVRYRDPQDGKWIYKPKPPDFPDPQPPKPQPPKTNPNPKPSEGGK
jgi:RHS repeat-associated protein